MLFSKIGFPLFLLVSLHVVGAPFHFPTEAGKWKNPGSAVPGGIHWEFSETDKLTCAPPNIPTDWSEYNALAFSIETNKPTNRRLSFVFSSEDRKSPGMDYYLFSLKMNFKGRQDIVIPFKNIGPVRKPLGWDQIAYFQFHNNWGGKTGLDDSQTLTLRNLRLIKRDFANEKGPRLSDENFFQALDLDRPELQVVKAAVLAKNIPAAKAALAKHFKTRRAPRWFVEPQRHPFADSEPLAKPEKKIPGGKYQQVIPLNWSGWKKFTLPLREIRAVGKPVGWQRILGMSLQWRIRKRLFSDRAIHLDEVRLTGSQGEFLIEDFEQSVGCWQNIDSDHEIVRQGRGAGKWSFPEINTKATCTAVPADWSRFDALEFYLHNAAPSPDTLVLTIDSNYPNTARADKILTHTFVIGGWKHLPYEFGDRFDWSANATRDAGESNTVEWNAQLNRHFHFSTLYRAYWQTGDEAYAKELAWEMNSWIEDNPILLFGSGNSPYHHAWETLNTAIRLHGSWPDTLARCIRSPEFTPDIICNILKSTYEQVNHLIKHPSHNNWLTAESLGLYVSGSLYPEFRDARAWRDEGVRRLYHQLEAEVYPGGMQVELALGYNNWVLREFVQVLTIAKLNGLEDELPDDYKKRIEKMYDYLLKDSMPDGRAFGLNDSGNSGVRSYLLRGSQLFPERQDFLYAITGGKAGEPPRQDSFGMPYEGHYLMRSGWDANDAVLHFDAGPFGGGHQHEDKLSLLLYAFGKSQLVEGNSHMYDHSRWRAYVLLSRSHNTALIDGMDQYRRSRKNRHTYTWPLPWDKEKPDGCDTRWHSLPGLDFADGRYNQGYREYRDYQTQKEKYATLDGVEHRRSVLYAKPGIWLVHDRFLAEDDQEHSAEILYHINAETANIDAKTSRVSSQNQKASSGITLLPIPQTGVTIVKGKKEPPVQGWSRSFGERVEGVSSMRAVPTAIFKTKWRESNELLTVLQPTADGKPAPISGRQIETPADIFAAEIQLAEKCSWFYLRNRKPTANTVVNQLTTDAEVALAGTCPGTDYRLSLIAGTTLELGSHSLSLETTTCASVSGEAEGTWLAGVEKATDIRFENPVFGTGKPVVYRLNRRLEREEEIPATLAGTTLSWKATATTSYEITLGGPTLRELRDRRKKQDQTSALDKIPVRALQPLPPASGGKLVVQAEDFAGQGGGNVEITSSKVGSDGKAFLHWDYAGHWLDYAFTVPADGAYHLSLRYCTSADSAVRAIVIDGSFPYPEFRYLDLPSTGGYSGQTDDWQDFTPLGADGKTFPLFLKKGKHTIRLYNVTASVNLDRLSLVSTAKTK